MTIDHAELFARLADYFPAEEVKFREGRNGGHYIKAPSAMARLDSVLGPAGWWDAYTVLDELSVECALTIRLPDGSTVTKRDVGIRKPPEPGKLDAGCSWKAAYSDALKRAAAKFGVARYLSKCSFADFVGPALEAAAMAGPAAASPDPIPSPPSAPSPAQSAPAGEPRTGGALYHWAKEEGERAGFDLLKYLQGWGNLHEFPRLMKDWDKAMVHDAHAEALRKMADLGRQRRAS